MSPRSPLAGFNGLGSRTRIKGGEERGRERRERGKEGRMEGREHSTLIVVSIDLPYGLSPLIE